MVDGRNPHRRIQAFSPKEAFNSLRDRTLETHVAGDREIRVLAEPMIARAGTYPTISQSENGAHYTGQAHPVRIQADFPITAVRVGVAGVWYESVAEAHPQGVRVYVPEVTEETTVQLELRDAPEFTGLTVTVRPARKWQVHLIHASHLDIGYTDPQPRVLREQVSFLDTALEHVEATADKPEGERFKWVVEALLPFQIWLKHRSEDKIERFIKQVKLGNIELTAAPQNVSTETASTPELHELFKDAQQLRERFGIELPVAMQTDIPGVVSGFVDAMADSGVKYFSVAHNWAGRSAPHLRDAEHMPQLFWLRANDGKKILTWMTDSGHGLAYQEGSLIGFSESYDMVDDLFPLFMRGKETQPWPFDEKAFGFGMSKDTWTREPYPYDIVHYRVMGRLADNAPANRRVLSTITQWNAKWAFPELKLSTNEAFFKDVEEKIGHDLPEFGGDWHNWWADGAGSSARGMQLAREAQNKISQLETLATLLPDMPSEGTANSIAQAWTGIALFDEHTWGAANPWTWGDTGTNSHEDQWAWKYSNALRAQQETLMLDDDISIRLAEELGHQDDGFASLWVFNSQAQTRSGQATVFLPESVASLETVVELRDPRTGVMVAHREIAQTNPYHREAGRFLVFEVRDIPGLGYTRIQLDVKGEVVTRPAYDLIEPSFDVQHSPGVVAASPVTSEVLSADGRRAVLENEHLRVGLDIASGAIAEITVLAQGKNLVGESSAFGFNTYIYDTYGTAPMINHMTGNALVQGDELTLLNDRIVSKGAFGVEYGNDGLGQWLSYQTVCGESVITTRLDLAHGSDTVEITNRVKKPATMVKEAGFFAFPFALENAIIRSEVSGSVTGDGIERVPGSAHYMHAMRHWVSLTKDTESATLVVVDAPLVQIADIALPYLPFPPTLVKPEPSTVFSWIFNNQWDTNYPVEQGLDMEFRYAVSGQAVSSVNEATSNAAATAARIVQPIHGVLASAIAAGPGTGRMPQTQMEISHPGVRLIDRRWVNDSTMLVRFQSVVDHEVTADVDCAGSTAVRHASMLGVARAGIEKQDGTFAVTVPAFGTSAVLVTW